MTVRSRFSGWAAALVLLLGGVLAVAGCGGGGEGEAGGGSERSVGVTLGGEDEFSIGLSQDSAKSGAVAFTITNAGKVDHEFVIVKTDLAPDAFAVEGDTAAEPSGGDGEVVDEVEGIEPGEKASLLADLEPGKYVFICNEPGHYAGGMHLGFTVE